MAPPQRTRGLTICSLLASVLLLALFCHSAIGVSYNEKCDVGVTADNRTLDNCDPDRNLMCQQSRCVCQDPTNQIWSAIHVRAHHSRSKRGHGIAKTVLIGGAAGAAGGFLGASLAQQGGSGSSSSSNGGDSSSSSSSSSKDGDGRKGKYELYYACHSRVGGVCVLDTYGDVVVTINNTITHAISMANSTVTVAPVWHGNDTMNHTDISTSTVTPVAASVGQGHVTYDVSMMKVPKCVDYAACRPNEVKIVNGTVVSKVFDDIRLGACQCKEGYKQNGLDVCVKIVSGAGKEIRISSLFVFIAVLFSVWNK